MLTRLLVLWSKIPMTWKQATRSYAVSSGHILWSEIVLDVSLGVSHGRCETFGDTLAYLHETAWAFVLGILMGTGPLARARQAVAKVRCESDENASGGSQSAPDVTLTKGTS